MFLKITIIFLAFILWLTASLLHLKFSLFLVQTISSPWGDIKLKDYAPQAAYLIIFLFSLFLVWYLIKLFSKKQLADKIILLQWLVWLVIVVLINKYLLATPLENIHFIQYAIISFLLITAISMTEKPFHIAIAKTLFWVGLAGIIDEIMQYLWITASYSQHLDFNDFILNLMGAIAGILVYLSFKTFNYTPNEKLKLSYKKLFATWEIRLGLLIVLTMILVYHLDYIQLSTTLPINEGGLAQYNQQISLFFERTPGLLGSWNNAFNGGKYYILSPLQGSLIFILIAVIFYLSNKKIKISIN